MITRICGEIESVEGNVIELTCMGVTYEIMAVSCDAAALKESVGVFRTSAIMHIAQFTTITNTSAKSYMYGSFDKVKAREILYLERVSGIGHKKAYDIVNSLDIRLKDLVLCNDVKGLCDAKGVASQTAKRIIASLRNELKFGES